jgi:hypothetical protein
MLGHRHRRQRRPPSQQRRLVRGRGHHHRPRQPLGAQHLVDEIAQLAPALADQRQHHHIGLDPAGELAQQHGLAHARPGEQPDPLPPDQGQQGVERIEPRGQPPAQPLALCRRRGRGAQRPLDRAADQRPAVQGPAVGVDDPADPAVVGRQQAAAQMLDPVAHRQPLGRAFGQDLGAAGA